MALADTSKTAASELRARLAETLCDRFCSQHPGQVLLAGVYGSTARREATPWSDLELLFIVPDACRAQGQHTLVSGVPVGYRVYRRTELEDALQHPDPKWPFLMGVLSVLQVIEGEANLLQRWIGLGEAVPEKRFRQALRRELPGLVIESHGRLHSCLLRGEPADFYPALLEVLFEMRTALCLLNRGWVTHDYFRGLADTFSFEKLPEGYAGDVEALYHSQDPHRALPVADRLVERFGRLLAEEGLAVEDYPSAAAVPV